MGCAIRLLTGKMKTAFRSTGRLVRLCNWIGSQKAAVANPLLLFFEKYRAVRHLAEL